MDHFRSSQAASPQLLMQKIKIPRSPSDVSLDWLNDSIAIFGHTSRKLIAFEMSESPQGQSSTTRRIRVTWAEGNSGSLFLKMLNPLAPFIELHRKMGVYHTEVGFYKQVREVGLRVPDCHVAEVDPITQAFVLLLEDVGPGRSLMNLDDAELAIVNLARFHSQWWDNEDLQSQSWLGKPRARCLQTIQTAKTVMATIRENPELELLIDGEAREALMLLFANPTAWAAHRERATPTLCHGDYHPGQMFFPTAHTDFVVFDWQMALYGNGAVDLVFFLSTALTEAQYRSHGRQLIEAYFNILSEAAPGYSSVEFRSDLGHGAMFVLMARLIAFLNTDLDEAKAAHAKRGKDWRERITYPALLATDLGGYAAVRAAIG